MALRRLASNAKTCLLFPILAVECNRQSNRAKRPSGRACAVRGLALYPERSQQCLRHEKASYAKAQLRLQDYATPMKA